MTDEECGQKSRISCLYGLFPEDNYGKPSSVKTGSEEPILPPSPKGRFWIRPMEYIIPIARTKGKGNMAGREEKVYITLGKDSRACSRVSSLIPA